MNNKDEKNNKGEPESINKSRRRLSKTGLAAPVLLSLASKPSWAVTCTFSGAMSGNLSAQQGPGVACDDNHPSTLSPGYYKNNPWPASALIAGGKLPLNNGTKFNDIFGSPAIKLAATGKPGKSNYVPELTNPSLFNVLWNNNRVVFAVSPYASDKNCAFHYVAALLNALNPALVFPFTYSQVIAGWHSQDPNFCNQLKDLQAGDLTVGAVAKIIKW